MDYVRFPKLALLGVKYSIQDTYKEASRMSVWDNLNYNNKLLKQFENKNKEKDKKLVVYNSNGKIIRSAVIDNLNYVIDNNIHIMVYLMKTKLFI